MRCRMPWGSWPSPGCTGCGMRAWRPRPSTSRDTGRWWPIRTSPCRSTAAPSRTLPPSRGLRANPPRGVMVAHVLFPAVDSAPASLSSRWIRDVLRGELRFQGGVFADDLSMGGAAAAYGDIVTRGRQALSAGCDMLPVCNNRASVIELLDHLDAEPEPAPSLRLVRLHGRAGSVRFALEASPEWTRARELLARATAAPALTLDAGHDT